MFLHLGLGDQVGKRSPSHKTIKHSLTWSTRDEVWMKTWLAPLQNKTYFLNFTFNVQTDVCKIINSNDELKS